MTVTPAYREFVIDQLASLGRVSVKRMFGGAGLYRDGVFFGLIDDDTVYLRVDDTTRLDFIARGQPALRPVRSQPDKISENYFQVPPDVLEDAEQFVVWSRRAITAAGSPTAGAKRKRTAKRARKRH